MKKSRRQRQLARQKEARRRSHASGRQTPKLPLLEVVAAAPAEKSAEVFRDDEPEITVEFDADETDFDDRIPDPPSSRVRLVDGNDDGADDDVQAACPDDEDRPVDYFSALLACTKRNEGHGKDEDDEILVPSSRTANGRDVVATIVNRRWRESFQSLRPYRRIVLLDDGTAIREAPKPRTDAWKTRDALRLATLSDAGRALDRLIYRCAWYGSRSTHREIVAKDVLLMKHCLTLESLRRVRSRSLVRSIWNEMHRLHADLEGREDQESSEFLEALWELFVIRVRRTGVLDDIASCIKRQVHPEAFDRMVDADVRKRTGRATVRRSRAA